MEGDKTADNEKELTSTSSAGMAKQLLSTNNEERNDSNDTLPTSSTDASTSIKSTQLASDDPISSTSSEMDPSKPKLADQLSFDVDKGTNCFDTDAELFGMSMSTRRSEDIEENVDDLVNDLETLLGESTDDFSVSRNSPKIHEAKTDVTCAFQEDAKSEGEMSSNADTTVSLEKAAQENPTNSGRTEEAPSVKEELSEVATEECQSGEALEIAKISTNDTLDAVGEEVRNISPDNSETKTNQDDEGSVTVESDKEFAATEIAAELIADEINGASSMETDEATQPVGNVLPEGEVEGTLPNTNDNTESPKESSDVTSSHAAVSEQVVVENSNQEMSVDSEKNEALPTEISMTDTEITVEVPVKDDAKEIAVDVSPEELTSGDAEHSKELTAEKEHEIIDKVVEEPLVPPAEEDEDMPEISSVQEVPSEAAPRVDFSADQTKADVVLELQQNNPVEGMEVDDGEISKASVIDSLQESSEVFEEEFSNVSIISTSEVASTDEHKESTDDGKDASLFVIDDNIKEEITEVPTTISQDPDEEAADIGVEQLQPITCDSQPLQVLESTEDAISEQEANTELDREYLIIQDEAHVPQNIVQDTEEIGNSSIGPENNKLPQDENESCQESTNSIKENIEIIEVTDDAIGDIENAEIVDVPMVVEDPEDATPASEERVEQNEDIEEVTDEQIVKEHLEEIKVEPVVKSSEQKSAECLEVTESVIAQEDCTDKIENCSKEVPDLTEAVSLHKESVEASPHNDLISVEAPEQIEKVEAVEEAVAIASEEKIVIEEQHETDVVAKSPEIKQMEYVEPFKLKEEITCANIETPIDHALGMETGVVSVEESSAAGDTVSSDIESSISTAVIFSENTQNLTEAAKAIPEIIIRRKTVEQDLEKVVCLSEESSDSDSNEEPSTVKIDQPIHDLPIPDEDANLIKIASEIEQYSEPELPFEEILPVEDILPDEAQSVPDIESVNATSNLETLMAVASLQNESVSDAREHRRLSEKEIREMEAIRMAVASITDSSQDTYDSFMVENSATMDNSTQDDPDGQEICESITEEVGDIDADKTNMEDVEELDRGDTAGISIGIDDAVLTTALDENVLQVQQNNVTVVDAENRDLEQQVDEATAATASVVNPDDQANNTIDNSFQGNAGSTEDSTVIKNITGGSSSSEASKEDNQELAITENDELTTAVPACDAMEVEDGILTPGEQEAPLSRSIEPSCDIVSTSEAPPPENVVSKNEIAMASELRAPALDQVPELSSETVTEDVNAASENLTLNDDCPLDSKNTLTDKKSSEDEVVVKESVANMSAKTRSESTLTEAEPISSATQQIVEDKPLRNRSKRSSKISEPLSINVEEVEKKEKVYSPKITIKPLKVPDEEVSTTSEAEAIKGSLKMTITKQSDKMHSILKLYDPDDETNDPPQIQEEPIPKLIIKPKLQHVEQQHSPKMTTRSAKVYSPTSTRSSSPRITIKPVSKPADVKVDALSSLKITIKPVVKPDEGTRKHSPKAVKELDQKNHNPKITIKPIPKPSEEKEDILQLTPKLIIKPIPKPSELVAKEEISVSTPKVTIRPLKRPLEETDLDNEPERSSPKITIKPLVKPPEHDLTHISNQTTPKIKIKPVKKHEEGDLTNEVDREQSSPKISIKPIVKPADLEPEEDEEVKQRIVLKINKGNLPTNKESKKRDHSEEDKAEKVGIKLKFSTTGGHTHIVQEKEDGSKRQRKDSGYLSSAAKKETEDNNPHKRPLEEKSPEKSKRLRSVMTPDKFAECTNPEKSIDPKVPSPIVISDDSRSQQSKNAVKLDHSSTPDISKIAALASQTTHIAASPVLTVGIATPTISPVPKRRGRPRKVPLKFREDITDPSISSPVTPQSSPQTTLTPGSLSTSGNDSLIVEATSSGGRPKRSCRGQNVMATLGIKPRKPRGRGRGSKVNMGDRGPPTPVPTPVEVPVKPDKAEKGAKAKLKLLRKSSEQDEDAKVAQEAVGAAPTQETSSEPKAVSDNTEKEAKKSDPVLEHAQPQSFEDPLKRKCEDPEDQAIFKKKKEDKTPTRKLEVTTRRQKAQLQKKADIGKPTPEPLQEAKSFESKHPLEDSIKDPIPSSSHHIPLPDSITALPLPLPSTPVASKESVTAYEKFADLNSKNYPDITITKTKSPPKNTDSPAEKPSEDASVEKADDLSNESNAKLDIKKEFDLDEEGTVDLGQEGGVDTGEDSESERQREYVLQKKQEAIKKCRAKRMEKLAKAAELKRKRQEQAAQQREARKAAEEAERVATERARATKRYGRYGVPKPQISLIDAPVPESAGTVKSHMGVSEGQAQPLSIEQPLPADDNADKEPLKNLEGEFTPTKSSEKLLFSEPMVVDSPEESPSKIRRSLAREDVVMLDEETRMSADFRGSRSQTPAKQSVQPADIMVEDSQGSVGTEGGKSRSSKAPKMEVFQDMESTVYTADQLAEYSWNGQGPFMIQEQVTQYLGIKSFKRKYPNITRRPVDIQERDYLKECGFVTEGQCDLGLTAVAAQDILDIMYADFQEKYEDYCKAQREKQARELASKQQALNQFTLKPGFDKLDILEQAVQSAAAWNSQFNKARREQRKAHMDLQNWSVQYPKSKMKIIPTPKIGHYPIALVPGQFTDYYKDYTPTELNNLPLNTMCYKEIKLRSRHAESEESSNGSDSDSESTSGSSSSGSSCDDANCKECDKKIRKVGTKEVRETDSDDVVFVENDASSSDSVVLVSVTTAPVTA